MTTQESRAREETGGAHLLARVAQGQSQLRGDGALPDAPLSREDEDDVPDAGQVSRLWLERQKGEGLGVSSVPAALCCPLTAATTHVLHPGPDTSKRSHARGVPADPRPNPLRPQRRPPPLGLEQGCCG